MPSGTPTKGIYGLSYIYDIVVFVGEMLRSCTKLMKIHHMIIYCSELICQYGGITVYFCVM